MRKDTMSTLRSARSIRKFSSEAARQPTNHSSQLAMFKLVLLIVLISVVASLNFNFGGKKSAPKTLGNAAAASKPAAKTAPAPKKNDMTWGGRPDPTPELYVDEKATAILPGWKFNLFGKKK